MMDGLAIPKTVEEAREVASRFTYAYVAGAESEGWARAGVARVAEIKAAAEYGLTRIEIPKDMHGGWGLGFRAKLAVVEEIAQYSFDLAFSLINTQNVAARLARWAPPAIAEHYLPALVHGERLGGTALTEPHAGSDFAAIRTMATKDGDGWRLNGTKAWITNASVGDVFIVYAQTDAALGWKGIACFLVDGRREGFERLEPFRMGAGAPIGVGGFQLKNYRAEADELLDAPGTAFKTAMNGVNGARTYVAGMCCAMVAKCLSTAIWEGDRRLTFGSPVVAKQGIAWMLADAATDLEAARLLVDKAADLIERGKDAALAAAHAKKFAARMAVARISDCMQTMGARGLLEEHVFVRHLASARVAHYVDGTTEMQNERIAAILFK